MVCEEHSDFVITHVQGVAIAACTAMTRERLIPSKYTGIFQSPTMATPNWNSQRCFFAGIPSAKAYLISVLL